MNDHFQALQSEASTITQEVRRQSRETDARVGGWLLVGNAAALLFCFNAAVNGAICDWSNVRPFAIAFFLGMVWALSAIVLSGELASRTANRLQTISSAARMAAIAIGYNTKFAEAGPLSEEAQARVVANNEVIKESLKKIDTEGRETKVEKRLQLQANICMGLSAVALGAALLAAIATQLVPSALCPTG